MESMVSISRFYKEDSRMKKDVYVVEVKVDGEWKLWNRYDEPCLGSTPKERAEKGFKIARCYAECRIRKIEEEEA